MKIAGVAIAMFVATNLDDILILAMFFAQPNRRAQAIVAGQFLGIGALVAASSAIALAVLAVPRGWTALLGVVPVAIGIRRLLQSRRAEGGPPAVAPGVLSVAGVTIASGGDNLGVYVPVFAQEPWAIPRVATIFAIMTAVWCAAGWALVAHPIVQSRMQRYGHRVLPWVLIAIGVRVLWAW